MKRNLYLTVFIAFSIMTGCGSPTSSEKAEKAVTDHLAKTMNDPDSYQPVNFYGFDSTFTGYYESEDYKKLREYQEKVSGLSEKAFASAMEDPLNKVLKARHDSLQDVSLSLYDTIKARKDVYKGEFNGYSVNHKFRGKNVLGALVINDYNFMLDTNFTVTETHDNGE